MSFSLISLLVWLLACPWLLFPGVSVEATAAAMVVLLGMRLRAYHYHGYLVPPTPLNSYIFVYLLLSLIAFLISPIPAESLRRLLVLLLGVFGYFALIDWAANLEGAQKVLRALVIAGLIITCFSFFVTLWPARHVINVTAITARLPHLSGTFFLHHNQLASGVLLLLPVALYLWWWTPSRWERLLYTAANLLMGTALLFTQSRNAWLGLLLALLIAHLWSRFHFRYLLFAFLILAVIPFLLGALPQPLAQPVFSGLAFVDDSSKLGPNNFNSWSSRLEMWSIAMQMMQDYPVLGAGLYSFEPVSRINYVYRIVDPTFAITHAHNLLLQTGSSLGWAGVFLFIGFWATVLYKLWQVTPGLSDEKDWLSVALGASFTGYLWFNLFDVFSLEQRAGILIWVLLATFAVVVQGRSQSTPSSRLLPCASLALPAVLCLTPALPRNMAYLQLDRLLLASSTSSVTLPVDDRYFNSRRLGLYFYLKGDVERALNVWQTDPDILLYLQSQAIQTYYAGDFTRAIDWCNLAVQLDSTSGQAYYWRAVAHQSRQELDLALVDYARSIRYSQQDIELAAEAWAGRGWIFSQQGNWEAASHAYDQAVALAPDNLYYRQRLEDIHRVGSND